MILSRIKGQADTVTGPPGSIVEVERLVTVERIVTVTRCSIRWFVRPSPTRKSAPGYWSVGPVCPSDRPDASDAGQHCVRTGSTHPGC
jgi:hypothetical protein